MSLLKTLSSLEGFHLCPVQPHRRGEKVRTRHWEPRGLQFDSRLAQLRTTVSQPGSLLVSEQSTRRPVPIIHASLKNNTLGCGTILPQRGASVTDRNPFTTSLEGFHLCPVQPHRRGEKVRIRYWEPRGGQFDPRLAQPRTTVSQPGSYSQVML